jgi:putative ABC transport system permease protein
VKFALRMAWRDFRAKPSRFAFYVAAIALGVGSITAIEALRQHLSDAIEGQGRNLLGADLLLRSRRPFSAEQRTLVEQWPGRKAQVISYRTMLLHPGLGTTRMVEVEALDEPYPFYGSLATEPADAARTYQAEGSVLLDETLMVQMQLSPGDDILLGGRTHRVAGALRQTPGEVPARSLVAPRVFLPLRLVDPERTERPGFMARFEWYLAHEQAGGADDRVAATSRSARQSGLDVETVASRRAQLLGSTDRISRYLGVMGFTSLMIGCLGVAGAVQFFVASKKMTVAQLRCLGASLAQAAGLFAVQLGAMAVVGSTFGVALGAALSRLLPALLAPFLPVEVPADVPVAVAVSSWSVGMVFTMLAGLFPITRLRGVRPLAAFRIDTGGATRSLDAAGVLALALLTGALALFSFRQLGQWTLVAGYLGGVAVVFGLLALTGFVLRAMCRRVIRAGWPYSWRLAVSGLYRPQNQTGVLVISLGLGVFLLNTIDVMEQHMLQDVAVMDRDRPNLAMIDIQTDQRESLLALLDKHHPRLVFVEPMITMRLAAINGVTVDRLEQEPGQTRQNWALKREFRTTYRKEMKPDIESVIAGQWVGEAHAAEGPAPVSLEKGIAEALLARVGDRLLFDIHGEFIETRVANIREVDWKSMQPNFFVIFPVGFIEDAPQSLLVFAQVEDLANRAAFQRSVVEQFPNVTVIDVSLMMGAVSAMLAQLSVAVRSIAWVTLLAGFLVLLAILRAGRQQRLRDAILLRTIGASRRVVASFQAMELVVLTMGAMASGLVLSWTGAGLIVHFVMKLTYAPDWTSPWGYMLALTLLTGAVGWLNGRSALRLPPASAWRALALSSS